MAGTTGTHAKVDDVGVNRASPSDERLDLDELLTSSQNLVRVLYRNVRNTPQIRKMIFTTQLPVTLIKPKFIVDKFQLSVATTRAYFNQKEGLMKTKTIATEIIYSLSPSRNISDSLKTFSAQDNDDEFLIIAEENALRTIEGSIEGEKVPMSELQCMSDMKAVIELFKIPEEELRTTTLRDSVISRMSTKEYNTMSYQL